jgi:outer membrane assembly lipoprotein YfiO
MFRVRKIQVLLMLLAMAPVARAAPATLEFRNGRWVPVQAPATAPTNDATLDQVERLLKNGQPSSARKLLLWWIRNNPNSPLRDRGVFLLGQVYFDLDDRILAFYHFDEVMDTWPDSPLFSAALARQYEIADAYLSGYKRTFLGMRIVDTTGEAIEMMFRIQQRAPGSPLAEKALLRTADFYYSDAQFDLAADAYAAYVHSYPRSPYVPKVRLRQAFSSLAQFRGTRFDATAMIDARAQLADLLNNYPALSREENVAEWIANIDRTFAKKFYERASFYRRTHEPQAAAYTLRQLMAAYPASPEADHARKELAQLEAAR